MAKNPPSELKQWVWVLTFGVVIFFPISLMYFYADPNYIKYPKIQMAFYGNAVMISFCVIKIIQLLVMKK